MRLSRTALFLLLLPALVLLLLMFVGPIAWFLANSLSQLGGWTDILDEVRAVLGSRAVIAAILNTHWIALMVTALVLLLGYPVAFGLSRLRGLPFTLVLVCIVLPYFTSIIVRTYAWMVLLGRQGLINQMLLALHLTAQPLDLIYNRVGVIIGMTYVLLPYMVLTLFGTMRAVDPRLLQAASGMGAKPFEVFRRVFLPLTRHGVVAGVLIVFILAVGFFITPALMGGPADITIAMLIEREIEQTQNWPDAALMTLVLLAVTLVLYGVYSRFAETKPTTLP